MPRRTIEQYEQYLADIYLKSRPNLQVHNPAFCILFAAAPGSGKSTLCHFIVNRFRATYFCNDEVRQLIADHSSPAGPPNMGNIVLDAWSRLLVEHRNHFVVFDNTITNYHWNADSFLNTARRRQIPTFIVAIDLQRDVLAQRIVDRGLNVDDLLSQLDEAIMARQAATKDLEIDFTYTANNQPEDLARTIDARLHASRQ